MLKYPILNVQIGRCSQSLILICDLCVHFDYKRDRKKIKIILLFIFR
jgi:hypothetical protein